MKIDRHNYEEFFILYWDNELTAEQKQQVEAFVAQHADLEAEFRLLQQTRFVPEKELVFEDKDALLKSGAEINLSNYEIFLLSYIDDELNAKEKNSVEQFALQNPAVQQELDLLKKTKLEPEYVIFPDKSTLYRKERKVRVIEMRWFRVAAAAVLIFAAGLLLLINNSNTRGDAESIASVNPETKQSKVDNPQADPAENNGEESVISNPGTITDQEALPSAKKIISEQSKQVSPASKQDNDPVYASIPTPEIKNENNPSEIEVTLKSFDKAIATQTFNTSGQPFNEEIVTQRTSPAYDNMNSSFLFASNDEDASSDKGGLRGFLRKTTRIFERRTNIQTTTDDNKLLVGAFTVSLK